MTVEDLWLFVPIKYVNLSHGKVEQQKFLIFSKSHGGCRAFMTKQKYLNEALVWTPLVHG